MLNPIKHIKLKTRQTLLFSLQILFFTFTGINQTVLTFNNNSGDGVYIGGGTGAGTVGAIYEWPNVGTEGLVTIKANIEIIEKYGGATLTTIDGSSSAPDWEPQISGPSTTAGNFWGIKFQIRFYDAADDSPYNLGSFIVQGIDIDGGGSGSALREFNTFETPDSYELETPTEITSSVVPEGIEFLSSDRVYSGISILATEFIASCNYSNINSLNVICGVKAVGGSCSGNRLHSINFRNVVVFNEPVLLPVGLTKFTVERNQNNDALIEWTTASEINNYYFTLEQSANGYDFYPILVVDGAGTTHYEQNYSYIDKEPLYGLSYYRLKQTDFNGQYTYSDTRGYMNDLSPKEIIGIYNIYGQRINETDSGFAILSYSDGTSQRIYK